MEKYSELLQQQRDFFQKGSTKDIKFRINSLKKLYNAIKNNQDLIIDALNKDLNKSDFEAYMTEVGFTLAEISYLIKNLKKWVKAKKVKTPITQFIASSYIVPEPYGVTLIISPWNYPFQLAIAPLAGSIAAGNCAIIKPSEYSKETSLLIDKIIKETFESEYIEVVLGDREVSTSLLEEKFDYIFFTGSINVGKAVMSAASKHLTPITLELGGKSPCIVDATANIDLAAKRIIWGKFINSGQTCVAPDYVLVDSKVKSILIESMKKYIIDLYDGLNFPNKLFPKIINERHYNRLLKYIENEDVIIGGKGHTSSLQIEPTLLNNVKLDSKVMEDEIFGPILPIIEFKEFSEVFDIVNNYPKPLALYLFTNSKDVENKVINNLSFGGGCINDTIVHLASTELPFGGVGSSGMGSYHGKASFDTFTHYKAVMKRSNLVDLNLRYPPYTKSSKLLKKFLK